MVVEQETVTYMENERSIEVAATRKEAPKARLRSLQLLTLPRPLRPHRLPQPWWMKNMAGKRTLQYISNPYRLTYFSWLKNNHPLCFICLRTLACLLSKMPIFQWVGMKEGGNEGGREATPTSISVFDSYDMKTLWFKFDHDIFSGFKMPRL